MKVNFVYIDRSQDNGQRKLQQIIANDVTECYTGDELPEDGAEYDLAKIWFSTHEAYRDLIDKITSAEDAGTLCNRIQIAWRDDENSYAEIAYYRELVSVLNDVL